MCTCCLSLGLPFLKGIQLHIRYQKRLIGLSASNTYKCLKIAIFVHKFLASCIQLYPKLFIVVKVNYPVQLRAQTHCKVLHSEVGGCNRMASKKSSNKQQRQVVQYLTDEHCALYTGFCVSCSSMTGYTVTKRTNTKERYQSLYFSSNCRCL